MGRFLLVSAISLTEQSDFCELGCSDAWSIYVVVLQQDAETLSHPGETESRHLVCVASYMCSSSTITAFLPLVIANRRASQPGIFKAVSL
jgi:hypothetical protein